MKKNQVSGVDKFCEKPPILHNFLKKFKEQSQTWIIDKKLKIYKIYSKKKSQKYEKCK